MKLVVEATVSASDSSAGGHDLSSGLVGAPVPVMIRRRTGKPGNDQLIAKTSMN